MTQLTPIQLDDNTVIYLEADETAAPLPLPESEGKTRTSKGAADNALRQFQALQGTIKTYTAYTLKAFQEVATANIDKVTLEFGIKVAGEGGVPYVTKGSGECNLKVTVKCSFPKKQT